MAKASCVKLTPEEWDTWIDQIHASELQMRCAASVGIDAMIRLAREMSALVSDGHAGGG